MAVSKSDNSQDFQILPTETLQEVVSLSFSDRIPAKQSKDFQFPVVFTSIHFRECEVWITSRFAFAFSTERVFAPLLLYSI